MDGRHVLAAEVFQAIAAGDSRRDAFKQLHAAQTSKHLLLAMHLFRWAVTRSNREAAAVRAFCEAYDRNWQVVHPLVTDPMFAAWVAMCIRRHGVGISADPMVKVEVGAAGSYAATAALRTGIDVDLWTRATSDGVFIPSLGLAHVAQSEDGWIRIAVRAGRMAVHVGPQPVTIPSRTSESRPWWREIRRLTAHYRSQSVSLRLDDLDPARDCFGHPPAPRLSADQFEIWARRLREAWRLLARYAPARANEIAFGLRVLVPLDEHSTGTGVSITSRLAFGALAMTLPDSPASFAVGLVHELAHSKLNALMNYVRLYDDGVHDLHFSPWRPDPRPTSGLLQGAYAFLAVADTWSSLRNVRSLRDRAEHELARTRRQVREALEILAHATDLTRDGQAVARAVRGELERLNEKRVPEAVALRAQQHVAVHRAVWRIRNLTVDMALVDELADRFARERTERQRAMDGDSTHIEKPEEWARQWIDHKPRGPAAIQPEVAWAVYKRLVEDEAHAVPDPSVLIAWLDGHTG